ncbi:hypothetical protein PGT21_004040 [Puccinia graminis f. sp. tritici]|uniref:Ricin B lectin domain-containing protein n=1 Tax=Puccinia graminis f. sp. tritici TaxID=56615 RepID=A0A5B0N604_PUCGR|nr:hypothetical protein PGTUg99_036266 [Puccinia graminis f. sp. tritici]KAA1093948.1 hypothetical protein PGT21_004040 [Puccinia graminis f. sp. tritici]
MTLFRYLLIAVLCLTHVHRIASEDTPEDDDDLSRTVVGEDPTDPSEVTTMRASGGRGGGGSRSSSKSTSPSTSSSSSGSTPYRTPYYYPYYYIPYGHGGYRSDGYGSPPPARILAWDYRLRLNKGNVTVVDTENGRPLYTISKAPHRGFIITNQRGDVLLRANDNKKAPCGFGWKYHTPMNVSYSIDPRGASTDRWKIELYGNGREEQPHTLKYYRAHKKNKGKIIDKTWGKTRNIQAARLDERDPLDKSKWEKDTLWKIGRVTTLEINDPTIGDHYFIGLWAMVHIRWDRCINA